MPDLAAPDLDVDEAAKLARLNAMLQVGIDQLDRGQGIVVTDVKAWLDSLGRDRSGDAPA
jgi:hypothetical protein